MSSMFSRSLVCLVGLIGVATSRVTPIRAAGPPPRQIDQRLVARLVEQLGAEKFSERQAASKALIACGRPALKALYKAASHEDLEIRQRARKLIESIDADVIALRARGVRMKVDDDRPDYAVVSVNFAAVRATNEDMRRLARQPALRQLTIHQGQVITDTGLAYFRDHPSLAVLVLHRAKLTSKGLRVLDTVKNLKNVIIDGGDGPSFFRKSRCWCQEPEEPHHRRHRPRWA